MMYFARASFRAFVGWERRPEAFTFSGAHDPPCTNGGGRGRPTLHQIKMPGRLRSVDAHDMIRRLREGAAQIKPSARLAF
jgi:hypothetical protein